MTVNELYKWMANPSALTKASLQDLKQLVEEYPYFQAARLLYLKNLSVVEDVCFQKELRKMSVYIPDRKRLYMLIESKNAENRDGFGEETEKPEIVKTEEPAVAAPVRVRNQPVAIPTADYLSWLESNVEDIEISESENARLKHQDLIDSFIESDGKMKIGKLGNNEKKPENGQDDEIISLNSTFEKNSLDDSYFTETLARVYFSQKRYDKALEIIRALNLKYPEKNIYFADQIRYLEKIINLKK